MQNTRFSFLERFFSRFSILQKFIFISCIYGLSIIVAISWMVSQQNEDIRRISLEIKGTQYKKHIRALYESIALHHNEIKKHLAEDAGNKNETIFIDSEINAAFQNLIDYDNLVEDYLLTKPQNFEQHNTPNLKPIELQHAWNQGLQNIIEHKKDASSSIYFQTLNNLEDLTHYIAESSELFQNPSLENYYLINTVYIQLNEIVKFISIIDSEFSQFLENRKNAPEKAKKNMEQIEHQFTLINWNLKKIKENFRKIVFYSKNDSDNLAFEKAIQESYEALIEAFDKYSQTLRQTMASNGEPDLHLLDNELKNLYIENFSLADVISKKLENSLNTTLSRMKREQWISIATVILIALAAFWIGLLIMKSITEPLKQMVKTATAIGDGDLLVRVPIAFDDEVGKVGQAFNKMADSLQDLLKQLQWAGVQLTTSTTELASTAKQQEVTIVEQESTTKQIAVTAKEISALTKDFARTMKEISATAENTSALATTGKEGLHQMELTMRQMVEAAGNIAAKLAVLNEKASTITNVVTTIAKVADQTNLLSLNAAIEAEKAGEQGRSFGVIAREIRRLADQTANATLDIEKMINEMVSAVSAGVMGVDKFSDEINTGVNQVSAAGEQLSKIIEQVQLLTGSFESVNEGMQTQFTGAEQINESILQLSETAQQTTESIRQFHRSIEQLNHAAIELQSMVTHVKK